MDQLSGDRSSSYSSRRQRRFAPAALVVTAAIGAALSGCALVPPARGPIGKLAWNGDESTGERLIVFLPGRGGTAADFEKRGCVSAALAADPELDLVAVDAHFGYYRSRTLTERIWADILQPARETGYREIWLVGTSMGGLGALQVARTHPEAIAGMVLLAPYLGPSSTIREVSDAGGLESWRPENPNSWHRELWAWLKGYATGEERPPVILGYGDRDRLARASALLAAALPADRVLVAEGGHGWRVWGPMWSEILGGWFRATSRDAEDQTALRGPLSNRDSK